MDSSRSSYVLGVVTGAALAASATVLYYQWYKRTHSLQASSSKYQASDKACATAACQSAITVRHFEEDDILTEQFTRNIQFFGLQQQKDIANAFVVVVGLGVSCLSVSHVCKALDI